MASTVFQITAIIENDISGVITHAALTRKMGKGNNEILALLVWQRQLHGVQSSNELEPRGWKRQCLSVTPR